MENLEILKGIVSDETYAALEAETKDSKIKLGDLSSDKYVSKDKYKELETQLSKVNSALTEKTKEYDSLKDKAGDNAELKNEIERLKSENETTITRKTYLMLCLTLIWTRSALITIISSVLLSRSLH